MCPVVAFQSFPQLSSEWGSEQGAELSVMCTTVSLRGFQDRCRDRYWSFTPAFSAHRSLLYPAAACSCLRPGGLQGMLSALPHSEGQDLSAVCTVCPAHRTLLYFTFSCSCLQLSANLGDYMACFQHCCVRLARICLLCARCVLHVECARLCGHMFHVYLGGHPSCLPWRPPLICHGGQERTAWPGPLLHDPPPGSSEYVRSQLCLQITYVLGACVLGLRLVLILLFFRHGNAPTTTPSPSAQWPRCVN